MTATTKLPVASLAVGARAASPGGGSMMSGKIQVLDRFYWRKFFRKGCRKRPVVSRSVNLNRCTTKTQAGNQCQRTATYFPSVCKQHAA